MPKYIVDAPEVKSGEELSSGGIRRNGRIVAQYRNPTPYNEPEPQLALTPVGEQVEPFSVNHPILSAIDEEVKDELKDIAYDLWQTEIKPYIKGFLKRKLHSVLTRKETRQEIIETTYANSKDNNDPGSDVPIITITKAMKELS